MASMEPRIVIAERPSPPETNVKSKILARLSVPVPPTERVTCTALPSMPGLVSEIAFRLADENTTGAVGLAFCGKLGTLIGMPWLDAPTTMSTLPVISELLLPSVPTAGLA